MSFAGQRDLQLPWVKICGLCREEDLLLAARLGAWAVGFVFAESPRRVSIGQCKALVENLRGWEDVEGSRPLTVGVFIGSVEGVVSTVEEVGLDGAQLHGGVGARELAALRSRLPGTLLLQAIPMEAEEDITGGSGALAGVISTMKECQPYVDVFLLDTSIAGQAGGTGRTFPWRRAAVAASASGTTRPILVAGGLHPGNVRQALAEAGARGVDVSSRIESRPGEKDSSSMEALFAAVGFGGPA